MEALAKAQAEIRDKIKREKKKEKQSSRTYYWQLFSSEMTIISTSHSLQIIIEELCILKEKREVVEM